jgi:hypothetical protein
MQCDKSRLSLRQRMRGSTGAVNAVQNTRVFQTETTVDDDDSEVLNQSVRMLSVTAVLGPPEFGLRI